MSDGIDGIDGKTRTHSDGCPPESVYSVYVDRELEAEETRAVETHLVRCRACRELVMALEEETTLLRAAFRVEEQPEAPLREAAPARGLVVGVGPAVVAALACLSALGWVVETRIPSPIEWLNPFSLSGAFEMFFDTVFMLRDEAPALYQLVVASSILFGVAFLLTTTLSLLARRLSSTRSLAPLLLGGLLSVGLMGAPATHAVELRLHGDEEIVPEGETVEETWVISADEVTIAGTLRGDLIVFAERVLITGELDGDLFGVARRVEISGHVTGSIAAFGERLRVSGQVDRNAYGGGDEILIAASGEVGRDLVAGGDGVVIAGRVGRDVMTFSEWLEARGEVGRNLTAHADRIEIFDAARIGGNLTAKFFEDEEDLEISSTAIISGTTSSEILDIEHPGPLHRYQMPSFYLFKLVSFLAALATGMVLFRFAPWIFSGQLGSGSEFFRALGYGFVALVAVPLFLVILALTVIGIPMAAIGFGLFAMSAYFAKIVVGGTIGMALLGEPEESDWTDFGLPLAAGLGIVVVTTALPFLGKVVGFIILLTGLGMLVEQSRLRYWK